MTDLWLSRLTLKRTPEVAALVRTLLPDDPSAALASDHRLVWSAFAAGDDAPRRFLWRRDDRSGRYFALGPPPGESSLFDIESKPFAPDLAPGDRLGFALRLNATVDRKDHGGHSRRHDVAMDLLRTRTADGARRAEHRQEVAAEAARYWLDRRAASDGFALDALHLEAYRTWHLGRGKGRIGVLELEGTLSVVEPERFLNRVACGFGRARAFGCGLMLLRRVP